MANFSDTEIESAVTKFVREDVKTERTDLGPLSTNYAFNEVREFVASTLVFDPSAIFYLLSLAANRVNQDVEQALEYLDDIILAIDEVGRDTTVVTQTSLLEDAAAALIEVERTIENNNAIATRPFTRYEQALETFTAKSLTPNIRRLGSGFPNTYEVVRPPQKAQSSIKTNIAELRDLHVAVIEEATQLTVALSEFLAAELPLASIQSTLPKVRNDLRSLKSQFDSAGRDGAIEITRDAFLSIQAGLSVVTNLTSISDPRESRMKSSALSTDRAAAASTVSEPALTATPAEHTLLESSPHKITPTTNEVRIEANGGTEQLITLPVSAQGVVEGTNDETYDIHDASAAEMTSGAAGPYTVPAAPDNVFDIYVDGVGYRATLTSGSRTAAQVSAEVNAATRIDGGAGTFDDVGTASDDAGSLKLVLDTAGDQSMALGDAPALNTALGFTNLQEASGQAANNQIRFWVDHRYSVVINLTNGPTRTAAQVAADIGSSPYLVGAATTVDTDSGTITVPRVTSADYGEGSVVLVESLTPTQEEAVETLGFSEGQEGAGSYLSFEQLYEALSGLTGVELDFDAQVVASGKAGLAVLDGGSYELHVPTGVLAGADPGDTLLIKNGENAGSYPVSAISTGGAQDEITVTRAFPAVTGAEAQNQNWELHRNQITIRSTDVHTSTEITVNSCTAATVLGLVVGTYFGSISGVRILDGTRYLNFSREDVATGDRLLLNPGPSSTEHYVTALTYDGYQIEVDPEVPSSLTGAEYQIDGSGALAYADFIVELSNWFTDTLAPSKYDEDINELERTLNPLLVSKNPSAARIGSANTAAQNLRTIYSTLSTILADFTALVVTRIDALLDMLQERGLDRAHDLLLLGQFENFFAAGKDESSYGGNLLEKMRSIAQNDVPQGRGVDADNVDDRLTGSYEETDAEYDFSDQDDETGVAEIDDVPDLDDDADVVNRSL